MTNKTYNNVAFMYYWLSFMLFFVLECSPFLPLSLL